MAVLPCAFDPAVSVASSMLNLLASLPGTVVSNDRCNDVELSSNSPAPVPHPDGRAHPDEKLHATRDPPCNQAEPGATVVASTQPSKEDKDKRQPMMTLSTKKEYRKKRVSRGSIVNIGDRTTRVVRTPDAQEFAVKYATSVILGEQGTYLRKFGDHAMAKEPNTTLIASDQGFKPAKHLVVEVESIMSIKAASVCPRGCSEQRSVYVVGPMVPKDRVSPEAFDAVCDFLASAWWWGVAIAYILQKRGRGA